MIQIFGHRYPSTENKKSVKMSSPTRPENFLTLIFDVNQTYITVVSENCFI